MLEIPPPACRYIVLTNTVVDGVVLIAYYSLYRGVIYPLLCATIVEDLILTSLSEESFKCLIGYANYISCILIAGRFVSVISEQTERAIDNLV